MSLTDINRRQELLARFERATELPLIILAILMLPLLLGPVVVRLPPSVEQTFVALDWFIWAVFALDLIVRTSLAEHRLAYLRRNWLDVLIIILPFLRPLRILRAARLMTLLRLTRVIVVLARVGEGSRRAFHVPHLILGGAVLTCLLAILVYLAEKDAGGTIDTIPDALWWAVVTVATVGYGDVFPITPMGRGLAVVLIIGGISLFSALSATLAAFLLSGPRDEKLKSDSDVAVLHERLDRLERLLQERLPVDGDQDKVQLP